MPARNDIRRILAYTHNAIGLGHAVRTLAVVEGLRAALPGVDFLVLGGGSSPQLFLTRGIETIKLPGLRHDLDAPGQPFRPRYLASLSLEAVLAWRQRIIAESLAAFRPQVVLVEHSLAGLMGEASPLLAAARRLRPGGHVLAHLSRGIYRNDPSPLVPDSQVCGLPPGISVTQLYDVLYVLEERDVVDVNAEFFGADPALEERIRYLGRVAARNPEELRSRDDAVAALGLRDRDFALLSLGRHGRLPELHARLFASLRQCGWMDSGKAVLTVFDPYLGPEAEARIRSLPEAQGVRFLPFLPGLVEVMAAAGLVVCRAGYNTVNELLLTGAPALVIPESHPSREQERRAAGLSAERITVLDEQTCLGPGLEELLAALAARPRRPCQPGCCRFDRYAVGERIAEDLCRLAAS